jgi:hypothetical protein
MEDFPSPRPELKLARGDTRAMFWIYDENWIRSVKPFEVNAHAVLSKLAMVARSKRTVLVLIFASAVAEHMVENALVAFDN